MSWEDVRFKKNDFAELALRGDLSCFSKEPSLTPELTNTGSFEKGWKYEDGSWWLYKEANELQKFSELFVYELCKELGFTAAVYEDCGEFVRTSDFTEQRMNLEPAAYLVGDDDDYVLNYRRFKEFGDEFADRYLEVVMMDVFCRNGDRHTGNYGLLRDVESGRVLRLAPNFDNNLALLSRGYEPGPRGDDFLAQELRRLEEEEHAISGYAMRNRFPVITPELIAKCCERTGVAVDVSYDQQYVMAGYEHSGVPEVARARQLGQVDELLSDAENRAVTTETRMPSYELGK